MTTEKEFHERAARVLAVIYKMSNGMAGVPINKHALLAEINRSGVMRMSDEEFSKYKANAIKIAGALRN